jgi:hypothetical protein
MSRSKYPTPMLFLLAGLIPVAASSPASAQAGSTGGTIGNTNKSAVSAPAEPVTPDERPSARRPRESGSAARVAGPCERVVGSWSWMVAGFSSRAVFFADHTAIHTRGGNGRWTCSNGQYTVTWSNHATDRFAVSADRSTLSGVSSVMGLPVTASRQ